MTINPFESRLFASSSSTTDLKLLVILERAFGGAFNALTLGVLYVYVVSIGGGVVGISVVVGASGLTSLILYTVLYKHPSFLLTHVRRKYVLLHFVERILFLLIPFSNNYLIVAVIYAAIAATPTNAYMNLTIYGSFSEKEIKDVTAKRSAMSGVSSVIGFVVAMILLAFLPPATKFVYVFGLGVALGLVCTIIVVAMNLSHLQGLRVPEALQQPERLLSTSLYFVLMLAGGALLSMVWVPYLMDYLRGPDYLAVAMNLVTTLMSVGASLVLKTWPFRDLRYSIGLDAASPLLALMTPIALIHPILSAFSSFTYTGSNFLGSFLFAKYNQWLGAVRSSLLTLTILAIAQLAVAPLGILVQGNYVPIFLAVFGIKLAAFLLALTAIPEAAVVSPETARTYSFLLYNRSISGYRISVEFSKETVLTTLRLIAVSLVLLTLYVIYRALFLVMNWK
jgi:hypothetical protein